MHRIDADGNVSGLFTDGNPAIPQVATEVDAAWLNDVQENVCQAVEAAGIALVKGTYTQLTAAIQALILAAVTPDTIVDAGGLNAGTSSHVLRFGSGSSGELILSKRTAGGNQFALELWAGGACRLLIGNTGAVTVSGNDALSAPVATTVPSFSANFSNGGTTRYWKDATGKVHVEAHVLYSSTDANGLGAFTLPSGFRPTGSTRSFPAILNSQALAGLMVISTGGNVSFQRFTGVATPNLTEGECYASFMP